MAMNDLHAVHSSKYPFNNTSIYFQKFWRFDIFLNSSRYIKFQMLMDLSSYEY